MKSNLTKLILLFAFSILNLESLICQSWQWGLSGGGGSDDFGSSLANENVYKMGTDAKGNLYVAWVGFGGGTKIGGDTVIGANGNEDCMVSKFTCNGIHLWTKVIGNDIFSDGFTGFGVDSLGNTYSQITGYDDGLYGFNIDTDTTFLDPIHSSQYSTRWWIIKYDSAGTLQWYKAPEGVNATIPIAGTLSMEVMTDGTMYSFIGASQNTLLNGTYTIQSEGFYILKFDNQGNILSHTPVSIKKNFITNILNFQVAKNKTRYYLSSSNFNDYRKDTVGNIPIQGKSAICAFDMQGNQLWVTQFPDTGDANSPTFVANSTLRGKIATDNNGNVYFGTICGIALNSSATIAGFSLYNDTNKVTPFSLFGSAETIFKIDSNGNYVANANEFQVIHRLDLGLEVSGQKLIESGVYIKAKKGSFNLYKNYVFGINSPNIYLAELDINTMQYTKVDSLVCNLPNSPTYIGIGNIHSDKNGQVYLGGQFPQDIIIAGTTFNAIGGKTDMFIAKWGDTCGANLLNVQDSRIKIQDSKLLEVYPNPASNNITISINNNLKNVELIIYDMMGKKVYSEIPKSKFSSTINTSQLPSGLYNVILKSNGKLINSKKLIIER